MPPIATAFLYASILINGLLVHATPSSQANEVAIRESFGAGHGKFSIPTVRGLHQSDYALKSRASNEKGTVDADSNWYINVSIGTPPQTFLFLIDTGSAWTVMASTLLPKHLQSQAPLYNPNISSTAKQVDGEKYGGCFASGYCSNGVVFQDVFTVGNLTIENMYMDVQTNNSGSGDGTRTGTLGLNFNHKGQPGKPTMEPTWLQTIMPNLQSGVFTVDYDASTSSGTYDFGFIDKSKHNGPVVYSAAVNVNSNNRSDLWTCNISGQQLANGTYIPVDGWQVTVDTGTGDSHVPQSVADDYYTQIEGATYHNKSQSYTFPCSSDLKDFTFGIGNSRVTIPAAGLAVGSSDGGTTCSAKLGVGGDGMLIWGRSFIEEMFVVFDWDNEQLGFANKSTSQSATTTSQPEASTSSQAAQSDASLWMRPSHLSLTIKCLPFLTCWLMV